MPNPRSLLDRSFSQIQDDILRMGSLVDSAVDRSLQALKTQDDGIAKQIISDDEVLNDLRFRIEENCLAVIATQQPMATDLRVVIAAMNIVNDMERMGDHAKGIAKTVTRMNHQPITQPLGDITLMADLARDMLKQALDAYVARDTELARKVAQRDDDIDALYNQIFRVLLSFMIEDPRTTTQSTYLLWTAHNLERIGDRVTNIAERVIYMTTGMMKELNVKNTSSES